jgi:hypothetical protein
MSTNGWKPRKIETLTCPSGVTVQVRRPGPEFMLRAGRVAKGFSKKANKEQVEREKKETEGMTPEEFGLHTLANMDDEELANVMIFARELVCAMMVSPKLVREPHLDSDEIGPEDIGDDFWFLFNYAMTSFYNLKVPVGEGEVEVADLETFRPESGVSGTSTDSESIPSASELPA